MFAGQVLFVPLQFSATSQTPAAARHTVELGSTASAAGQPRFVPSQLSAMSQIPFCGRHTTEAAAAAHCAAPPSQLAAVQVALLVAHSFAGSVPPVIGLQAPLLPVVKLPWHDSQVALHTTSQHTAPPGSF
jgi:hypothetical protein